MKVIAKKNNLYNMNLFLNNNKDREYVEGFFINIARTRDNKIIIFDFVNNDYKDLINVEDQTLEQIDQVAIVSLEEFLKQLVTNGIAKQIYINILLNFNILEYERIKSYLDQVLQILSHYPTLDFHLCSENQNVLSNLKTYDIDYPIGYIVLPNSYIDVDFYVFSTQLLSAPILAEQHAKNKQLLVDLNNWSDLQYIEILFDELKAKNLLDETIINEIRIIGEYPEIIYRTLNTENEKN